MSIRPRSLNTFSTLPLDASSPHYSRPGASRSRQAHNRLMSVKRFSRDFSPLVIGHIPYSAELQLLYPFPAGFCE